MVLAKSRRERDKLAREFRELSAALEKHRSAEKERKASLRASIEQLEKVRMLWSSQPRRPHCKAHERHRR